MPSRIPSTTRIVALALAMAALPAASLAAPPARTAAPLTYIGQQIVPSGTRFEGAVVGGLSAIDRDPSTGRWRALSDDRGRPQPPRFFELELDLERFRRSATPGFDAVRFTAVHTLRAADGQPYPNNVVDPEGLRLLPSGALAWSDEGQRSAAGLLAPGVREISTTGRHQRALLVPPKYVPTGSVAGTAPGDAGVRNNLGFESLTLDPDGRTLWAATENALVQDGPATSLAARSPSRMLALDLASGEPVSEFVYEVEPVARPPQPEGGFTASGLVELLALGGRRFLALERSFSAGAATPGMPQTGQTIRLFCVDAREATDVLPLHSLAGRSPQPARKTLLLDLSTLRHDDGTPLALDNVEGLGWGPLLRGRRTLVLVSDDNFNPAQFTQFIALRVTGPGGDPRQPAAALCAGR
jgi:hypothetical protein